MSFIKKYGRCYQKFDIIKSDPIYTPPTVKENLLYAGVLLELLNAGSTNDGTIQYSSNGTDWSTEIPSGINAGSYTLYWKLVGDANHSDVASTSIAVSVAKVNPTYIAPTGKTGLEYTGEAQALLNAGSTEHGTIKYSLDGENWSTDIPTDTAAQIYTVYWKLDGDNNHSDVVSTSISVEIAAAQVESVTPPTISGNTPFTDSTQITISANDDAEIRYTTDNTTPTSESTLYSAPFTLNTTTTVKAIAIKDGVSSEVATKMFIIEEGGM